MVDARHIEIAYSLTPEDATELLLESSKHLPDHVHARRRVMGVQRQTIISAGLIALCCLYGSWRLLTSGHTFTGSSLLVLAALQFMIFARFARPSWYERETAQQLHGALSRGDYEWIRGDYRLIVNSAGVRSIGPYGEMHTRWAGIDRILRNEQLIMIILRSRLAHIVPCRSFSDRAEFERFFALSNALQREYGQHPIAICARYLADRDAPCVSCGYNLRNVQFDRCPECGELIDINELKARQREA